MELARKIDLSVYYWLNDLMPDMVSVYDGYPIGPDGFPEGELQIPSVASVRQPLELKPFELGGCRLSWYFYIIDVYGLTKSQRDDMAYIIQTNLDNNVPVYNYDEGFPPGISPTRQGTLVVTGDIRSQPVYVFPELAPKKYWRAVVDFIGHYSPT